MMTKNKEQGTMNVSMIITKFGHSCLLIEEGDARILIDPGKWSEGHTGLMNLDAVFITHEHPDHCHRESLQEILRNNPNVSIVTNAGTGKRLTEAGIAFSLLENGQTVSIRGVSVQAAGKDHAIIHHTFPHFDNTGYLIAGRFFHPGDSLEVVPNTPIEILALPAAAPWMKLSDAIEYAEKVQPKTCILVHDGFLIPDAPFRQHIKNILASVGIDVIIPENGTPMKF